MKEMETLPSELFSVIVSSVPQYYDEFRQFIATLSVNKRTSDLFKDDRFWHQVYLNLYGNAKQNGSWFKMVVKRLYVPLITMESMKIIYANDYYEYLGTASVRDRYTTIEGYIHSYAIEEIATKIFHNGAYHVRNYFYDNHIKHYIPKSQNSEALLKRIKSDRRH